MPVEKLLYVKSGQEIDKLIIENGEEGIKSKTSLNKWIKGKEPKKRGKTKKKLEKDKPNHVILRGKEDTSVKNCTGEIIDTEDYTSTEIFTQIAGETPIG